MSSVSAVGSSVYYPLNEQNGIGNDFQTLAKALNSGDLSSAQSAFSALQTDLQKIGGNQQASQSSSTLQNDIQTLGDALKAGDLSGAQKAFATLQQDAQNQVQQGHHHHHHHHHQVSTDQSTTGTTTASPDGSSTGTSVNLIA
jgi:ribosomal protein S20